ncbi:MAG: OmpA family protein [Polyangiales bacterium]
MRRSRVRQLGNVGLCASLGIGTLLIAASAFAQGAPAPAPLPPAPAPAPAPAPLPAAPAPAPAPMPAPAPAPAPMPAPAPAPAPAAGGTVSVGGTAGTGGAAATAEGEGAAPAAEDEGDERARSLHEVPTPWGPTGLLYTPSAMTGAAGTFRLGFYLDWFSTSSFLCTSENPCTNSKGALINGDGTGDKHSHIGSSIVLSATFIDGLEGYAAARVYANSNDSASPQLLQVLGDTTLGLKYVKPIGSGLVNLGGGAEVLFLNGTGGIGLSGSGTSFRLRALSTFALDKTESKAPLRFHLGLAYLFDNSGNVVSDVEDARTARNGGKRTLITRQERYGLGINKVDRFEIALGAEGLLAQDRVRPFLEYSLGLPMNRQGFECPKPVPVGGGTSDGCLGLDNSFGVVPSRLTLGVRGYPFSGGLAGVNAMAAFDLGVTGVSKPIAEVAPQAPWTLWFGFGLAVDTVEKPPKTVEKIVEKKVEVATGPTLVHVRGVVHEAGTNTPVPNAIVTYVGATGMSPLATAADGVFGDDVQPGTYQYSIKADGYKEGTCGGTAVAAKKGAGPAMAPAPMPAPAPGTPPGAAPAPAMAPAPATPGVLEIDCALEALPKVGSASLSVVDADAQTPVSGVTVVIADANGANERTLSTDANGVVKVEGLTPGGWTVKIDAEGYFATKQGFDIKAREETKDKVGIRLRPKDKLVVVEKNEIKIKQQVHFATDKAVILGDSVALLEEVADVLIKTPRIKKIEIQGHTDNAGTKEHNQELSQARAEAVRNFLIKLGVEPSRLEARGYGQGKPIAPNINEQGKAKNRRVQFVIIDQENAPEPEKPAKKK